MTPPRVRAPIVAIAYRRADAAAALDMGPEAFDEHVRPHIRCVRRGAMVLFPVSELQRWVDANMEGTL